VAVAWRDARDGNGEIYLSVVLPEELDRVASRSKRITYTAGASVAPDVAWNGPVLGLAWSDDTEDQAEIYFQFFDANGRDLTVVERQTETARASRAPSVVPWGETFALAWSESAGVDGATPSTAASEIAFNVVD
jgi:hypothetical protein